MRFSLLLAALGLKLRMTAKFSASFRKKARKKDFKLAIRADNSNIARTYEFISGKIRSIKGYDTNADTELVWCDVGTAVKVMLSKNELDGFSAIGRSDLKILGNFENALWFMELAEG